MFLQQLNPQFLVSAKIRRSCLHQRSHKKLFNNG